MDTIDVSAKYQTFGISIPARTAAAAPTSHSFDVGQRIVDEIEVFFPPGHVALSGVRVEYAAVALLPWNQSTAFIVGDNDRIKYEFGLFVSKPLVVKTCNTDSLPHTVFVTFKLREVNYSAGPTTPSQVPLVVI